MPFQFSVNLDSELESLLGPCRKIVLSPVRDEVYGLSLGGNRHAKAALKLLEKYILVQWPGKGDASIIEYVKNNPDCIVVTNDKALRKELSTLGVKRIMMFEKSRLGWDE